MIRLANYDDIPELLRMGKEFYDASGYKDVCGFNYTDVTGLLVRLIDAGTLLTNGDSCMLGFTTFNMFFDVSCLSAQELFWWVDKDKRGGRLGLELFAKTEEIAKNMGVKNMIMLSLDHLDGEKVNRIYEKLGYVSREKSYMRSL